MYLPNVKVRLSVFYLSLFQRTAATSSPIAKLLTSASNHTLPSFLLTQVTPFNFNGGIRKDICQTLNSKLAPFHRASEQTTRTRHHVQCKMTFWHPCILLEHFHYLPRYHYKCTRQHQSRQSKSLPFHQFLELTFWDAQNQEARVATLQAEIDRLQEELGFV